MPLESSSTQLSHWQAQVQTLRVKLCVTQKSFSDHPRGEQRRDAHVYTCLHFFIGIHTLCMSNFWSSVWKCRTKQKGTGVSEGVCLKGWKKVTDVFQLNGQSCKHTLGANNLISVLFTVTFHKPHITPFKAHIGKDAWMRGYLECCQSHAHFQHCL